MCIRDSHYPDRFRANPAPAEIAAFFTRQIAEDNAFVDFAKWENQAAGYTFCTLNVRDGSPISFPTRHLHVEHIAVTPEHQRKGIATALLSHAGARAKTLGCTEINLTSWAANDGAHTAFETAGFHKARYWFARPVD